MSYHDDFVPELVLDTDRLVSQPLTAGLLAQADAVVILTPQPGIDWAMVARSPGVVLDTRAVIDRQAEGVARL